MKNKWILILFTISLFGCFVNDYKGERIKSASGNFEIQAIVNRTNKSSIDYATVIVKLYDKKGKELAKLNTKAGDANKWAIGWTKFGDTLVLQSSDVGNKAWVLINSDLSEIEITDKLNKRAEYIYLKKYN